MPAFFIETSALVKLYVQEQGSSAMIELATRDDAQLIILSLSIVEFRSALERRMRRGDVPPSDGSLILGSFHQHVESLFITKPASEDLLERASELVRVHGLRAYDAVQLAACLIQNPLPVFVCSDKALLEAARLEGVTVFDPTTTA